MKHMAQILKDARERMGISLRQAAKRTGVAACTLSRLERGDHANPTFITMQTLTDFYNLYPQVWFSIPSKPIAQTDVREAL